MSFLDKQDVQIETSNPLYYPDDSAPPVPNITLSQMVEKGTGQINKTDYVALSRVSIPRDITKQPTAYTQIAGTPSTKNYSSDEGVETVTGDHIFFSRLNVEARIPTFKLVNENSLETYFRELAPAVCGVHNYAFTGTGEPIVYAHSAHNLDNSFAVQGGSNEILPLSPSTAISSPEEQRFFTTKGLNNSEDKAANFDVVDYIVRVEKKYIEGRRGVGSVILMSDYLEIGFFAILTDDDFIIRSHYVITDRSGDDSAKATPEIIEDERLFNYTIINDESAYPEEGDFVYFAVRTHPSKPKDIPQLAVNAGIKSAVVDVPGGANGIDWPTSFYNLNTVAIVSPEVIYDDAYRVPMSVQVLGYKLEETAPDFGQFVWDNTYPSPFEYYYPIYGDVSNLKYPIILPGTEGNIWEHVNRVATNFPYKQLVG